MVWAFGFRDLGFTSTAWILGICRRKIYIYIYGNLGHPPVRLHPGASTPGKELFSPDSPVTPQNTHSEYLEAHAT